MIYIPTLTSKLGKVVNKQYDYILYSPNPKINDIFMGNKITIWDNYTFYLWKRLRNNKQEVAYNHYLWFINYIQENWREGITVIAPDVDWLEKGEEIEKLWLEKCFKYPQLIVPNTWRLNTNKLNVVGYALRKNSKEYHSTWNHCLGHKRNNLQSKIQTYDSVSEILN